MNLTTELFGSVDDYINNLLAPDDDALSASERAIIDSGIPQISVSRTRASFYKYL
ncbi:MAG: hypothetical protein WDO15_28200 [Bacteroidota bacterium]